MKRNRIQSKGSAAPPAPAAPSKETKLHLSRPVEIKAVDAKERTFEGIAAAYSLDHGLDVIKRGAFAQTISRWKQGQTKRVIPLIDQHVYNSVRRVVGRITDMEERDAGLWAKFVVVNGQDGDEILERVAGGFVNGLSIGYRAIKFSFEEIEGVGMVRNLEELALEEVSLVIWGMNEDALITPDSVKSRLEALEKERSELLAMLDEKKDPSADPAPDPASAVLPEAKREILRAKVSCLLALRSAPRESAPDSVSAESLIRFQNSTLSRGKKQK